MRIIVSAGGSYGHIHPALSIIRKFQEKEPNLEVLYIGTHNRMEHEMIPNEHIPYEAIEVYGFTRNMKQNFKNIFCLIQAKKKCLSIMREFRPDVVIGVGGYVTYPVLYAAHKEHIKTFLHEQNSIPGKSNKMLAPITDLIGVSFKHSIPYFKTKGKIVYTGHPCGAEAINCEIVSKESLGLSRGKKLVIIVAGSLGSGSLNVRMQEFLQSVSEDDYEVLYITGKNHYEEFIRTKYPKNVIIKPYVEHLSGVMKCADVVVSRAGAASLYEIVALHIPSIIIPSPNVANNHQYYNAKEMQECGAISLMREEDIVADSLKGEVNDLLTNQERRKKMIQNMESIPVMDSSEIIYREIKDLIS